MVGELLNPGPLLILGKLWPAAHIDLAAVEIAELEMVGGDDVVEVAAQASRSGPLYGLIF